MIGLGIPLPLNGPQSGAAPRDVVEPEIAWWSVEVVAAMLRRH